MKEGLQLILPSQALKNGADLWVISDPEHSSWYHKINWYLCFQIDKTGSCPLPSPSSQMRSLLEKYKISTIDSPLPPSFPVLVDSSFYLPNLWTVKLSYTVKWLNEVYNIWRSLNQPTLRLFVPKLIERTKIMEKWGGPAKSINIQYVLDD